jgi:hypothetical protein
MKMADLKIAAGDGGLSFCKDLLLSKSDELRPGILHTFDHTARFKV